MSAARRIREQALALGFDAAGIAAVTPLEARERFEAWLAAGRHGSMDWLATAKARERRADPARILPGVRSVVCVALCHEPGRDDARDRRLGKIARYAAGEDYHHVMRDKLGALERFIMEILPGARALWYSDTGAILERGFAERAGLGWIGKHSGLLSRTMGSWFLLGEVLVDRVLESTPAEAPAVAEPALDPAEAGAAARAGLHCGTCARCIGACPTGAIVAPYQVDARRCISYLTIELRSAIPAELRPLVGDWIFGCDVCQEVCPWNRFAPQAAEARLHARALEGWTLARFLTLDEESFARLFDGSPIRRAGRGGFLRNVCVALGNRREVAAAPALARKLRFDLDPLVRQHAAWALGEIGREGEGVEEALARSAARDPSPEVRGEASAALLRLGAGSPA